MNKVVDKWINELQSVNEFKRGIESGSSNSPKELPRNEQIELLLDMLRDIEKKPLRIAEMRALRTVIEDYLKLHQLVDERGVIKLIQYRFAIEFLPGISTLDLPPKKSSVTQNSSKPSKGLNIDTSEDVSNRTSNNSIPLNSPIPKSPSNVNINNTLQQVLNSRAGSATKYFLCSIRRNQSTLWTSFRLYIDGIKEMDNISSTSSGVQWFSTPVYILGTKKLKSGISSNCMVWKTLDSKTWKEKTAVGKIIRSSNIYSGYPLANNNNNNSNSSSTESNNVTNNTIGSKVSDQSAESAYEAEEVNDFENSNSNTLLNTSNSSQHQSSLLESTSIISSSSSGMISVAVNSRGMEKLINLTVALPKQSNPSESETNESTSNINENVTVQELESVVKSTDLSQLVRYSHLTVLRSKLPRKVTASSSVSGVSNNNSSNLTNAASPSNANSNGNTSGGSNNSKYIISFGKDSRIRFPSRKNVALDALLNDSSGILNNLWAPDSDQVPVLQMGKMDDELFALDFYNMTPFQAFTIAMAVFDQ